MTKSIIAGIIALVLVVAAGVVEVIVLRNDYEQLYDECCDVLQIATDEKLSKQQFDEFRDHWEKLREISELFLPHQDVYEINLRFAEAQAYVEQQDFKQVVAQLSVVEELLQYVPHLMTPSFNHIV